MSWTDGEDSFGDKRQRMSPNVRVSQVENNKNMKREEREHSRTRKNPPSHPPLENLPSYLSFPPPSDSGPHSAPPIPS